ncbi:hypothetical protein A8938_3877 [Algoriphagus zhangzhouensis]|nr:hypothetical protein A8938_3877 [Algoriphagus zhangzhouensis]
MLFYSVANIVVLIQLNFEGAIISKISFLASVHF